MPRRALTQRGVDRICKGSLVASLRNALQLTRNASAYRFVLGRDSARNSRMVLDFLNASREEK